MQKKGAKKQVKFEKWQVFKKWRYWPFCRAYSLCKMVIFALKLKLTKTCDKRFYNHSRVVLWKNGSKKKLIFEKWQDFEKWQNWPFCTVYTLKIQKICFSPKVPIQLYGPWSWVGPSWVHFVKWGHIDPNKNRSSPIKNRFGPQWKTIQPLDAYRPSSLEPFWLKLVGPFPFKCSGL